MRGLLLAGLIFFPGVARTAPLEPLSAGAGLPFDRGRAMPALPTFQKFPAPTALPEIITLSQLADRLSQDPRRVSALIDAIRNKAGEMGKGWPGLGQMSPDAKENLVKAIQARDKAFLDWFPVMNADELKRFITSYAQRQGPAPAEAPYPAEEELLLPGRPHDAEDGAFLTDWGHGLYHGDQTAHGLATAYADDLAFASALNRLALNEPGQAAYTLKAGDRRFTEVRQLLEFLASTGHEITAKDMRFFANFGGIWYRPKEDWVSVVTPLFLNTGLTLPSGKKLSVPVSHAHLELNVRGALVNADVIFYLGVGGTTMFYPLATADKPWVGGRAVEAWQGARAVELVERAATTRREIKRKVEKYKLPLGGYGALGGCADIHAMIVQKPVYPQIRDPKYYNDGMTIDDWAKALPIDDLAPPDRRRVYDSLPVGDSDAVKIPQSKESIRELRDWVAKP